MALGTGQYVGQLPSARSQTLYIYIYRVLKTIVAIIVVTILWVFSKPPPEDHRAEQVLADKNLGFWICMAGELATCLFGFLLRGLRV